MAENDDDGYVNEEPVANWINQRSEGGGRRKEDRDKCAMHDYCFETSEHCMDIVKMTIKDEVKKRDHKFELMEKRLEGFISKWAMGMIVTTCTFFLGVIFSVGAWQLSTLRDDIKGISANLVKMDSAAVSSMMALSSEVGKIREVQLGVLKELGVIRPEHKQLMDHWRETP